MIVDRSQNNQQVGRTKFTKKNVAPGKQNKKKKAHTVYGSHFDFNKKDIYIL